MGNAFEKLQQKLKVAQRVLSDSEACFAHRKVEHQGVTQTPKHILKQIETAHRRWVAFFYSIHILAAINQDLVLKSKGTHPIDVECASQSYEFGNTRPFNITMSAIVMILCFVFRSRLL